MRLRPLRLIGLSLAAALGCASRPPSEPLIQPPTAPHPFQPELVRDIDLLFMIDNTDAPDQANLSANFRKLLDALRSPKLGGSAACSATNRAACNLPSLRIGVVSSDLGAGNYGLPSCEVQGGDGGKLQNTARKPGCVPPRDPWISYHEGLTNVPSTTADPVTQVAEVFSCIAELGVGGCGFEHQLESVRRALDGCGPPTYGCTVNPGFLRKDALLAVVWLTDEDDCSASRPQLFDPSQQGLTDPLGPLVSFRCTEFGLRCDEKLREKGTKHNCAPGYTWLVAVDDYADFFSKLKPRGRVLLSAIAGPATVGGTIDVGLMGSDLHQQPSCQSINGSANAAIRIRAVVEHKIMANLGHRGLFNQGVDDQTPPSRVPVNYCSGDYSPALRLLGQELVEMLSAGACLPDPPLTRHGGLACAAGDDLGGGVTCAASCLDSTDCIVTDVTAQGTAAESAVEVPRCPAALFDAAAADCGASCPCWRITRDADCARGGPPYSLEILRRGATTGIVPVARCAPAPHAWGSASLGLMAQCQ